MSTTDSVFTPFKVNWKITRIYFKLNTYTWSVNVWIQMGPDRCCLTFLSSLHFWGRRTQTAPTITPNKRWQGAWWSMVETDRLMQTPDHIKSQFSSHPQFYLWFRWKCRSSTKLRTLRMIIKCHLQRPQVHTYRFQLTVNAMMNMNTMPNTLIMELHCHKQHT